MAASPQRNLREQQVLEDADVGIVFIRRRVIVRCNQCYADIFGYPSEHALVGLGSEHLHPSRDDLRSLAREAYDTLRAGRAYRTQRCLRRMDGSLFWGELTGRLVDGISRRFPGSEAFEQWLYFSHRRQRRVELVTEHLIGLPGLIVGTNRLAVIPRRLAAWAQSVYPLRILELPVEMPRLVEHLCWPHHLEDDPAHKWLRDTLLDCARGLDRSGVAKPVVA